MIIPEKDDVEQKERAWRDICFRVAEDLGKEIVKQTVSTAILGSSEKGYSVAKAMNRFEYELSSLKDA